MTQKRWHLVSLPLFFFGQFGKLGSHEPKFLQAQTVWSLKSTRTVPKLLSVPPIIMKSEPLLVLEVCSTATLWRHAAEPVAHARLPQLQNAQNELHTVKVGGTNAFLVWIPHG